MKPSTHKIIIPKKENKRQIRQKTAELSVAIESGMFSEEVNKTYRERILALTKQL